MKTLKAAVTDMIRDCVYFPKSTVCCTVNTEGVFSLWKCMPDELVFDGSEWSHINPNNSRRVWIKHYFSHETISDVNEIFMMDTQEYYNDAF